LEYKVYKSGGTFGPSVLNDAHLYRPFLACRSTISGCRVLTTAPLYPHCIFHIAHALTTYLFLNWFNMHNFGCTPLPSRIHSSHNLVFAPSSLISFIYQFRHIQRQNKMKHERGVVSAMVVAILFLIHFPMLMLLILVT